MGEKLTVEQEEKLRRVKNQISWWSPNIAIYDRVLQLNFRIEETWDYWGYAPGLGFRSIKLSKRLFDFKSDVPLGATIVHETIHKMGWQRIPYFFLEKPAYQAQSDYLHNVNWGTLSNRKMADVIANLGAETREYVQDQVEWFEIYKIENPAWRR